MSSNGNSFVITATETIAGDNKGTKERFRVFVASFMMYDNVVAAG